MLLAPARSRAEVEQLLRNTQTLRVNGRNVVRWVRHLAQVYADNPELLVDIAVSEARLDVIRPLDGVPSQVVDACVHATSDEDATAMIDAFNADREGYARARYGSADDPASAGSAEADAQVSV